VAQGLAQSRTAASRPCRASPGGEPAGTSAATT
jgi:hypothetical protein